MKISAPGPSTPGSGPLGSKDRRERFTGRLRQVAVLLFAGIFLATGTLYAYAKLFPDGLKNGIRRAAQDLGYGVNSNPGLKSALARLPERIARNILESPEPPKIFIDIKFKHLEKLAAQRKDAFRIGMLIQGVDDFVPATIRAGDRSIPVRLRLKGDMLDHLRGEKWSFRIHTKGNEHLFGLRRFSIQHPGTRAYQNEVLFHETLRRLDVLAPRYFFVDVVVNGNDIGVMAVEEHPSKELLESNGRKDGIIIRFDESLLWASRAAKGERNARSGGPFESYLTAPIDAFESSKVRDSEQLRSEYAIAAGLLRAFVDGTMKASEVFDVELIGRYLAAAELFGAWHAAGWLNERFYLNPFTMKLEPIGFDASIVDRFGLGTIVTPDSLIKQMLDDALVRASFERTLRSLKEGVETGELIAHLKKVEQRALRDLRTEYLLLEGVDFDALEQRARELPYNAEFKVKAEPDPYPAYMLAFTVQDGPQHYLELSNPLPHPVEVQALNWVDPSGRREPFKSLEPITYPLRFAPTKLNTRPAVLRIDHRPRVESAREWLEVTSRIAGHSEVMTDRARTGFPAERASPLPNGDIEEQLAHHPFLSLVDGGRAVQVAKGQWDVKGSIVIPSGFELRISAGTALRFEVDGRLIAYGATVFQGTKAEPIVLDASPDSHNPDAHWQGVVVHRAPARSQWSFVNVRHTSGVTWPVWSLTGGVTFYRSDVAMSDCTLSGNRAEDALNIIHSHFKLDRVAFLDTASDGFDSDFSRGTITAGLFKNIGIAGGSDGLDLSGSTVDMDGTRFINVSDKAVSVGEGSSLVTRNITVQDCGVGAVSKDHSKLEISDSTIMRARQAALMSYMKKPEYGPAVLYAHRIRILDTERHAQVQHGSRLEVDDHRLTTEALDVDNLYRTVMKPGLRQ